MRRWVLLVLACTFPGADTQRPAQAHGGETHTIRWVNGSWFDGERFVRRDVVTVDGILNDQTTEAVDDTVDLEGGFVIPPYADAHTHLFSDSTAYRHDIARFLSAGVLFVKNPNNPASAVAGMRTLVNTPHTVDAVFANGGITSSGGHPSQIYDPGGTARWLDDAYVPIDDRAALERKWAGILAGKPDFIKVYLEYSEEHRSRHSKPAFVGRYGIDPKLLPAVVERAHRSGLEVSCHVSSAADFRTAVASGVDEINHLPLERITPADAREAARRRVTVVTTVVSHRPSEGSKDLDGIHRDNLRLLAGARVSLALGTDHPALSVLDEADRIRDLDVFDDLALLRLLVVATPRAVAPARTAGSLEDGAEGTFLVLEGNPLTESAHLRRIRLRVKRGLVLTPPSTGKPSVAEAMMPVLMRSGVDSALSVYDQLRRERPDRYDFGEQALNGLGYTLMAHQQISAAVTIFKHNASRFQDSPNVYDSLADGLLAARDTVGAVNAYEEVLRALERSPRGAPEYRRSLETRARDQLARLRGGR